MSAKVPMVHGVSGAWLRGMARFFSILLALVGAQSAFAAAPTISGFSPGSGAVGISVTITGTNFSATKANDTVKFNGTVATVSTATTTQLVVIVPSGATTGTISVTVGGLTGTSSSSFTVTPTITSFTPTGGAVGTSVTITGTNFSATPASNTVKFNGTAATVSAATTTQLTVTVPSGATTGTITVTVASLTATSSTSFTVAPAIASFSPLGGAVGASVTITGTNFSSTKTNNTVKFNGTAATVSTATTTQLVVVVPSGATTGTITVAVAGLTATSSASFTVTPAITSFNPTSGPVGATVTIAGTNFSATPSSNTVKFHGTTASVSSSTTTQLVVAVPASATSGTITVAVNGQTGTSGTSFTITTPPTITGFSPTSGGVNTSVTITGTNFSSTKANDAVKFNGTAATVSSATTTQLVVLVPSGATSGPITVTVGGLTGTSSTSFTIPVPAISGFTPTSGPAGTSVTIDGSNFSATAGNDSVTFFGTPTPATVNSASTTQLSVIVPNGAATGPICVTVAGETGCSGSNFTVPLPTITSFSPANGLPGTVVTINGTNFSASPANDLVTFNGFSQFVNSATATQITVPVPAHATTGPICISVSNGPQVCSTTNFVPVPILATLTPSSGPAGTSVAISGSNFGATTDDNIVTFGTTQAVVSSVTPSQLVIVVPVGATSGSICDTVAGQLGCSSSSFNYVAGFAQSYQYDANGRLVQTTSDSGTITSYAHDALGNLTNVGTVPSTQFGIYSVSPNRAAVGDTVTIFGQGFDTLLNDNIVKFNGTVANVTMTSGNQLVTSVPQGASSGSITVTINGGATATSPTPFQVDTSTIALTANLPVLVDATKAPRLLSLGGTNGGFAGVYVSNISTAPPNEPINFTVLNPDTSVLYTANFITTASFLNFPRFPSTGTYTVKVANAGGFGSSISAQLLLVPQPATSLTVNGISTNTTTAYAGSNSYLAFGGTASQNTSLVLSNLSLTPSTGSVSIDIYGPSGAIVFSGSCAPPGCTQALPTLPVTGTYTIALEPNNPFPLMSFTAAVTSP